MEEKIVEKIQSVVQKYLDDKSKGRSPGRDAVAHRIARIIAKRSPNAKSIRVIELAVNNTIIHYEKKNGFIDNVVERQLEGKAVSPGILQDAGLHGMLSRNGPLPKGRLKKFIHRFAIKERGSEERENNVKDCARTIASNTKKHLKAKQSHDIFKLTNNMAFAAAERAVAQALGHPDVLGAKKQENVAAASADVIKGDVISSDSGYDSDYNSDVLGMIKRRAASGKMHKQGAGAR
jgi:hypothetical protein